MTITRVRWKRGTAADWTSANPVLRLGEPGWETDTHTGKVGDGTTAWSSLPYSLGAGGGGGGGPILSTSITDSTALGRSLITAASAGAAQTAIAAVPTSRTINGLDLTANRALTAANVGAATALAPTATKTTSYTAAVGDLVIADSTGGVFTITLPTAPADKSQVGVKKTDASGNQLTVARGGSDVFESGATTFAIQSQFRTIVYQYRASNTTWYPVGMFLTVSSLGIPASFSDLSGVLDYSDLPPGSTISVFWSGTVWAIGGVTVSSRPSARADLTFQFFGGTTAPSFGLSGSDAWFKDIS